MTEGARWCASGGAGGSSGAPAAGKAGIGETSTAPCTASAASARDGWMGEERQAYRDACDAWDWLDLPAASFLVLGSLSL